MNLSATSDLPIHEPALLMGPYGGATATTTNTKLQHRVAIGPGASGGLHNASNSTLALDGAQQSPVGRQSPKGNGIKSRPTPGGKADGGDELEAECKHALKQLNQEIDLAAQRVEAALKGPPSNGGQLSSESNTCPDVGQPEASGQFKLPVAKSHSSQGTKASVVDAANQPKQRAPQRRSSVFSFDGFPGLNELDQETLQQHSLLSSSAGNLSSITGDKLATTPAQQQQQATSGSTTLQQQSIATSTATKVGLATAGSSPRRSIRSDTLGSTGSSRASSCDEPPLKSSSSSSLVNVQKKKMDDADQGANQGDEGVDNDDHELNAPPGFQAIDVDRTEKSEMELKMSSSDASSNASSTSDIFDMAQKPAQSNCGVPPPPFESIRSQFKRDSVPDAEAIRQHIDKLISQNEAIIENWNSVSIRSYNSQATSIAPAATAPSSVTATTTDSFASSPPRAATKSGNSTHQSPRRPAKQRWSTTALRQSDNQSQQLEELRLQHSLSQRASTDLAQLDSESKRATQESLSQLVGARLRKRSYNNQCTTKRHPLRQSSDASALMLSPLLFDNGDNVSNASSELAFAQPLVSARTFGDIKNYLNTKFSANHKPNHLEDSASRVQQQQTQANFNQSVTSPRQTLQEDQRQQQQQQQQFIHPLHAEELLLASIAERQHQQLLEAEMIHQQQNQQAGGIPAAIMSFFQLEQHRHALEQQMSFNRLAALEQEYQQRLNAHLLETTLQQHHQQALQQSDSRAHHFRLMQPTECAGEQRQARDSVILDEFLAKMMLDRDDSQQHTSQHQPSFTSSTQPMQIQTQQQPAPIVRHSNSLDQRPSEMFTQPLDSATPSHRCDSCDISFWTRDLLNYHLITSCSARTGPEPAKPLAFNFNQPNGFDQLASPSTSASAMQQRQMLDSNLLVLPSMRFGAKPLADELPNVLDMTNKTQDQQSNTFLAIPRNAHQQVGVNSHQKDPTQSRSASPPRRRTYHEMEAPSQALLQIPAKHSQLPEQQQQDNTNKQQQQPVDSLMMHNDWRQIQDKQAPLAPRSPFKSRQTGNRAWPQQLDELCLLKQQLLTSSSTAQLRPTGTSGQQPGSSSLPIKKRKISEPNMRY